MQRFLRSFPRFKIALAVFDVLLILFSFFLAVLTHNLIFEDAPFFINPRNGATTVLYTFTVLLYFYYANLYKSLVVSNLKTHRVSLFKASVVTFIGLIVFQFLTNNTITSSRSLTILFFFFVLTGFWFLRPLFASLFNISDFLKTKLVIIGAGQKGRKMLNIMQHKLQYHDVVGFLDDANQSELIDGIPYLGPIENCKDIAEKSTEEIHFLLAIDNISRERFFEIFHLFQTHQLHFSVSSSYLKILEQKVNVDFFDSFGVVKFGGYSDYKIFYVVKRIIDFTLATIAVILLSPIFLVVALAVKLTSKGPIIYQQVRIGQYGKPFNFYKFRSMLLDSDKDQARIEKVAAFINGENDLGADGSTKIVNKARITKVGGFIRKYSLDELPQLFNVLKGEMSLVGPRPCIVEEWNVYQDWQKYRLNFIPGCTGIWQISGRSEVDFEDSVLMDIYYIQNYTPWLDLKIILKTIPVMLLAKGGE
ncbi:MAG: sugar transferase [Luteibaculaceae bacterium]